MELYGTRKPTETDNEPVRRREMEGLGWQVNIAKAAVDRAWTLIKEMNYLLDPHLTPRTCLKNAGYPFALSNEAGPTKAQLEYKKALLAYETKSANSPDC